MEIPNIVRNALYSKFSKRALRAQKLILSYLIKKLVKNFGEPMILTTLYA